MCVSAKVCLQGLSQLCAKMAIESSREETLLLLRQTISRLDRLKSKHLWSGNDGKIKDAFMDIERERYAVSLKIVHDISFIYLLGSYLWNIG